MGVPHDNRAAPAPPDAAELFRRHFESRFAPLQLPSGAPPPPRRSPGLGQQHDPPRADPDADEEWLGFEDELEPGRTSDVPKVEVVDHSVSQTPSIAAMSKRELKAFMSSRPPSQASSLDADMPSPPAAKDSLPEDAPSLLAQDLELRRLLAESHLLADPRLAANPSSPSSSSSAPQPQAFAAGRTRQKATDLRIQALGSRLSILRQEKMPMKMRKGMAAAATARESKRRREAKENGLILERESAKTRTKLRPRRPAAVDRPGVGRLKGAQLTLSERDIKSIEGGRDAFGRRSKTR